MHFKNPLMYGRVPYELQEVNLYLKNSSITWWNTTTPTVMRVPIRQLPNYKAEVNLGVALDPSGWIEH